MIQLLKRLLPSETLPAHIHFHRDDRGNRVLCDESACRPRSSGRPQPLFSPPIR